VTALGAHLTAARYRACASPSAYNLPVPVQFMLTDFAIKRVAMDPEDLCRSRLIPARLGERGLDELLLELVQRFIQINAMFDHLAHKGFQLLFH
jgi:hypothetical protein